MKRNAPFYFANKRASRVHGWPVMCRLPDGTTVQWIAARDRASAQQYASIMNMYSRRVGRNIL